MYLDAWKRRARQLSAQTYALYLAYRDPRTPWYAKVFAAHHQRGSTCQTEIHPHLLTTGLDNGAKELIRHSTTSSPRISTAPGVPVQIASPGRSVMTFE